MSACVFVPYPENAALVPRQYDPAVIRARGGRAPSAVVVMSVLAASVLWAGCGGQGNPAAQQEKAKDAEILNVAISQEMSLIDAYRRAGSLVRDPENRALMRQFVAQEQEHIDGWTKAMRGVGGQLDAEAEELDYSDVKSEHDYLLFAYTLTSSQVTHFLEDVTQLSTRAPQSFAASTAANEAQHLVVLRQMLGAGLSEAVPDSYDTGEVPPPDPEAGAAGPAAPPPGKE
jgi:rubrerythrin